MNTGLRITVFAAALAATFGAAYGVGGAVDAISPSSESGTHSGAGGHAAGHAERAPAKNEQVKGGGHDPAPPGGLEISRNGYTLDLKTPRLVAGKEAELRFAVVQDGSGRKVTAYQREHGKELHLILASRDLTVYRHLHPARAVDGTWSAPVKLPKAGGYRVFADFKPKGGEALTLGADLAASGTYEPAELPEHNTTARIDGYEVKLSGDLTPGKANELTLTVTKGGEPVRDLQPYLGAYGHLVALRSGDLAYLHVHPNGEPGDGKTRPGPEVSFTATAPSAGAYRLFLDFQHKGEVRTAAFTVHAGGTAEEPEKPSQSGPAEEEVGHAH
ncbi:MULTISPECIES: hypothetical protein [Streptomyces]|uniref:Secreted protein n=1 Tax=Streptomyces plicatus TaxID=1922 RepID=A0ABW1Y508_STRPL|nr:MULTISPECIES: hypothetical protein [Streptomyces]MBJ6622265.1 hypothetical protein [Streptomyces sp. DHE17-7]RSS66313.1 hypothetical protein EF907_16295 [Streptomyces sp. WAC06273]GGZ73344.1 hypothetical protein GCM10010301_53750 [Streptomyces plicatus]GHC27633.1 hypothetical protein GCM10010308_50810 [Streptomyces vinaceusdrappus]